MSIIMPTRRGFLLGALAVLATPAIVRASSLDPIQDIYKVRTHTLWGDGIHDDGAAIDAYMRGLPIKRPNGDRIEAIGRNPYLPKGAYRISSSGGKLPPVSATIGEDRHKEFVGPISMSGASLLLWDQK